MIFRAIQGDTLDSLIFRHYGQTAGFVEIALDFNSEAAMQPYLNQGQKIVMPDNITVTQTDSQTVNLWD